MKYLIETYKIDPFVKGQYGVCAIEFVKRQNDPEMLKLFKEYEKTYLEYLEQKKKEKTKKNIEKKLKQKAKKLSQKMNISIYEAYKLIYESKKEDGKE